MQFGKKASPLRPALLRAKNLCAVAERLHCN
jgi:hypothetical protein